MKPIEWAPQTTQAQMHERETLVHKVELPAEGVEVIAVPVSELDVTLKPKGGDTESRAERFLDRVQHGDMPAKAARAVGLSLRTINTSDEFKEALQRLMSMASLPGAVRAEMVRRGLDKTFLEGIESGDVEQKKLALAAAKLIAADPATGMAQQAAGPTVNVDLSGLADILKDLSLPGIPAPGEIIDAENLNDTN